VGRERGMGYKLILMEASMMGSGRPISIPGRENSSILMEITSRASG